MTMRHLRAFVLAVMSACVLAVVGVGVAATSEARPGVFVATQPVCSQACWRS